MKQYFLILNPKSGNGKGQKDKAKIIETLKKNDIDYDLNLTEFKGHAEQLARDSIINGYKNILIAGGDGTLSEVANGIMSVSSSNNNELTIGMIPIGTGNDWCREFNVPNNYDKAAKIINKRKIITQDLYKISYKTNDVEQVRYGINIAGVGFDSEVAIKTENDKVNGRGGKLVYIKNVFSTLNSYNAVETRIIYDNNEINTKMFSLAIGKLPYNGGGMKQLPNAVYDDGFLDFTLINDINIPEILINFVRLFSGNHIKHKKIDTYKTKSFTIETKNKLWFEVDGEIIGKTPFTVNVNPLAINLICG